MNTKRLGNSDLKVSPIGLGCMGLSHAYGSAKSNDEAIDFLKESFKEGYTFFDTAEVYVGKTSDGNMSNNEELVGSALNEMKDRVVIASKFGITIQEDGLVPDSSPKSIEKSLEGTLRRLNVETLDLYYQHRIDPNVEPEIVAGEMQKLIDEGLIKAWGISEANEEYLRRANKICPVTAIQNRYSMLARWHEDLFPVCEELGISFVAFSPMANGFLTGMYNQNSKFDNLDYRNEMPQYTEEGFRAAENLIELLENIAKEKNATSAQISLAWMINKKDYIIPIPGTTSLKNMQSNFKASDVKLSSSTIDEIDALLDTIEVPVFGGHNIKH
ncbi:aldo/keto reductase [Methanobrevibacter sp.]|uniref:aldo/keto reductase n=1 Tax=Methanobrevibacter sp. TaxID=66852 RepID=UPI0025D2720F|nr:aldo/keto reductase [Methanobrevibacter sp.]MBQ2665185.1 aldo/keto reductase [Methanobrevibacter sp.]